jgi:hypothetical protein
MRPSVKVVTDKRGGVTPSPKGIQVDDHHQYLWALA